MLNNVVKKVEKRRDELGIVRGEDVHAACTTNPKGTVARMTATQLGGVAGAVIAGKRGDGVSSDTEGLAARFVDGQNYVVLTSHRMLLFGVSTWTGKPTDLKAQWNRADVAQITVEEGRLAYPMTIVFSDGSAVRIEGAKGTNPKSLAAALSAPHQPS
ncbi:MAG: hypothetical protein AAF567_14585 [Actinomycetota bacterium]